MKYWYINKIILNPINLKYPIKLKEGLLTWPN